MNECFKTGLIENSLPNSVEQFVEWCVNDPQFFLEYCTKIRNQDGRVVNWRFNRVQAAYHSRVYEYTSDHVARVRLHDNIVLKSRQYGQSTYELGDMYWQFNFRPGTIAKVITYRDSTAAKLKFIVDLFHESACETFSRLGLDPHEYLAFVPPMGNAHELRSPTTGSRIEFTSEGAKGAGRSATVNRIYGTEYSEWQNISDVMAGYGASLVKDGTARVSLDFTARGFGNSAYHEYWEARNGGDSVYTAHFFGIDDATDVYTKEFLDKQRKRLRKKFRQEYPRTDAEAFLKDDDAIFDPDDINACSGDDYFEQIVGESNTIQHWYSHGVDSAEGVPSGDYTVITAFECVSGHEAYEPVRGKIGPRETAHKINAIMERFPGIVVVESNNHGHAVIQKCEDLIIKDGPLRGQRLENFLYTHEKPNRPPAEWKTGFTTDRDSKLILEADFNDALQDRAVTIVSENGKTELRQFCRLPNGKHAAPESKMDDGSRFYDDEAMAKMLAHHGRKQAIQLRVARTAPTDAARPQQARVSAWD